MSRASGTHLTLTFPQGFDLANSDALLVCRAPSSYFTMHFGVVNEMQTAYYKDAMFARLSVTQFPRLNRLTYFFMNSTDVTVTASCQANPTFSHTDP